MASKGEAKVIDRERIVAYNILRSVEDGSFSNLEVNKTLAGEEGIDKAFVRKLVYGVIERKLYLDYRLGKLLDKGLKSIRPEVLQVLRMGAYQLEFMDGVPEYAAIDTSVMLLPKKYKGLKGFVNGVLRNYQRKLNEPLDLGSLDTDERLSIEYSCSREIVKLLLSQYEEEEVGAFLKSSLEGGPLELRANLSKLKRDELLERLPGSKPSKHTSAGLLYGEKSEEGGHSLPEITRSPLYKEGLISIQSLGSVAIAELAGPKPGDTVVDVCAAPGGKSLAMAEMMENRGRIISMDVSERRISGLPEECKRLGIDIIEIRANDGRIPDVSLRDSADIVLVDAPCSGIGVIGNKPEIKYRDIKGAKELVVVQQAILRASAEYVNQNGRLVYSTCTINKEENENQVRLFLDNNPQFHLVKEILPMRDGEGKGCFYAALMKKEIPL